MTVTLSWPSVRGASAGPGGHLDTTRCGGAGLPPRLLGPRASVASFLAALLSLSTLASFASLAATPRDPLKLPKKSVMVTTTIEAAPGLSATLTEFFTGERNEKTGVDLLLGLHRLDGESRTLVASRDYNVEKGGYVSRGSLELIDLDRDGTKEILVDYHREDKPGQTRIEMEALRIVGEGLVPIWSGPIRVDTTNPTLTMPSSERERYSREIGYTRTTAAGGRKIYFTKTVSVAAGVTFDPPKVVEEEFDLAGAQGGASGAGAR